MTKILVVDDESSIVTLLQFNIEKAGFDVVTAEDGRTGYELALSEKPDLIVLDLMLPEMDGIEVCKQLRQDKVETPILMLTAKDDELDKIIGLELGADDYLTKPFSPREVVARIKAILRRSAGKASDVEPEDAQKEKALQIGELKILTDSYEVYLQDELLDLTPKEFELLVYLANHRGKVFSRDQLLDAVWNYDYIGETRIVDVHVSHLRDKIETDTKQPRYIKTIRGFGYKMENVKS
ncbi:response regulator transcription factor [Paenilisteria rocourtiae]|uniref:Two-component system alkaline phosphatase synthesis response regulator PhoP n=1 Tax=Listeria rocourtiae TaxID=647910 RepID=A0A4R6ZK49_9LIST|nr:response regulator transcription factor [Listeria rocourtiae]EUJ52216.1 DNA-binding response regulator [Listeria rocourtiae FSL F6-920]MBC1433870.1 response regulator transcription factor [Listeria rocourtiae]MBC1604987.1 response regulator transcription factor [Listeria rocourtiae]TDR52379.1 two-component system alkaline phosphatase synthesis response regulator PhoP [Listeria rocourtiae]